MTIQLIPESGIIRYVDNEGDVVRRLVGDLPVWVQRFIDDFVSYLNGDDVMNGVYELLYNSSDPAIVRWNEAERVAWESLRLAALYGNQIGEFFNANPSAKAAVTAAFTEAAVEAAATGVAVEATARYQQPIAVGMTITPEIFNQIAGTWHCVLPLLAHPPVVVSKAMEILSTGDAAALKAELDALIAGLKDNGAYTTLTNQQIINRSF